MPPTAYYRDQLTTAQRTLTEQDSRLQSLSNARLVSFGLGVLLSLLAAAWSGYAALIVVIISLAIFATFVSRYRTAYSQAQASRALVQFFTRGLDRIEDRLATPLSPPGRGVGGEGFLNQGEAQPIQHSGLGTQDSALTAEHPYAADLDLFGPGSLFELLRLGWTPMGDQRLARCLLHPADRQTALDRQAAVRELAPLTQQRETAAIRAIGLNHFQDDHLREWINTPAPSWQHWERLTTDILVVLNAATLAAWLGSYLPGYASLISVLLMLLWAWRLSPRTTAALRGLDRQADRLLTLSHLLRWFEDQHYHAPLLQKLQSELKHISSLPLTKGVPEEVASETTNPTQPPLGKGRSQTYCASASIAELAGYAQKLEWPRNAFFIPIALLMLWWTRLAFQVSDWRAAATRRVASWLDALGELEVLHSLATLAYERPDYTFPDILDTGRSFDAVQLGHPLIPSDKCRCNDVAFGSARQEPRPPDTYPQMLLISGSNMSGKSTLLRTVGISVVLALAGGPVKAKSLRMSILYPGATLRVQDSLQSGISRFYAEILRLRQLLDLAQEKPLLFLVDEILAGTNSAERRQGAAGILQALLDRDAIGLATTHDLALTEIAAGWQPRARNMHFADTWKDEQISFDYQLQPGVVCHGNALALMRAVGLKV